jgi:hypothetical protein
MELPVIPIFSKRKNRDASPCGASTRTSVLRKRLGAENWDLRWYALDKKDLLWWTFIAYGTATPPIVLQGRSANSTAG